MKKTSCFVCLMVFLAFMSACKGRSGKAVEEKSEEIEFHEIDLSKDFTGSTCDNLLLSDIVEDVEYVQLETTENGLVECYPRTKYAITPNDIFTLNRFSKKELFRFDRTTGKFISPIGQIGQGPEDMMNPSGIYAEKNNVYVVSSDHIYIYDKDGEHLSTIPILSSGSTVSAINDERLVYHPRQRAHISEGVFGKWTSVNVIDFEGNVLSAKVDTLEGITGGIYSLDFNPQRWYYSGQLNFYNEPDETVYAVAEEGIIPRYHFNLGGNEWPVRAGSMKKEDVECISFKAFKETGDYLYIYWTRTKKRILPVLTRTAENWRYRSKNLSAVVSGNFSPLARKMTSMVAEAISVRLIFLRTNWEAFFLKSILTTSTVYAKHSRKQRT